ncbi:hypothetical protein PY365_04055 [Roseiarcaceae bacterium H3SJ34-1]|uniref:hypothetical protein n=1 Tax=Terripilifer ovatus TaxID=3032367 RepID=UPI003AB9A214|nr:hypothetical protein [Roseiarcaceae bacterium H3SJ34-1]
MTTVFRRLVLSGIVALAAGSLSAAAQDGKPAFLQDPPLMETTLDIDHDGKMDRAIMMGADLYIYLSAGDEKPDLSRKPSFLRKDLATARVLAVESRGKGKPALIVKYGCGGCSNDFGTTLTIVYRGGQFLVGGVTYDWDTRSGIGSCDINFFTGRGIATHGLHEDKRTRRLKGIFAPVKLADWSDDKRPKACGG